MKKPHDILLEAINKLQDGLNRIGIKVNLIDARTNQQQSSSPSVSGYEIYAITEDEQADHKKHDSGSVIRAKLHLPKSIRVDTESKKTWYEICTIVVQSIGMGAAIAVAIIYYRQLSTMNKTLGVNQQQFDMSRKTAERESRALVSIKAIGEIKAGINEVPTIQITLTNLGKTIARKVVSEAYMEIVPRAQGPTFSHPDGTPNITYKSADMFPGDTDGFPDKRGKAMAVPVDGQEAEEWPLSKPEYESLTRGDTYLAAHGIVVYVDVYQVSHWSRFCTHQFLAKDPVLGIKHAYASISCTEANTTDTNEEP